MPILFGSFARIEDTRLPASRVDDTVEALAAYGKLQSLEQPSSIFLAGYVSRQVCAAYVHYEKVHVWADARIDNLSSLKENLRLPSQALPIVVIAEAYLRWGDQCPQHLLGDFTFVVWDEVRRTAFCARDPFGIRTFHYHLSPKRFSFCSCPAGLVALLGEHPGYDEPQIANFLEQFGYDRLERTFLNGCLKLKPSHSLLVTPSRVAKRQYWAPDQVSSFRFHRDSDYVEALTELLETAVRCRLPETGKVGTHLSGGLDCSTVTVLANRLMRERGTSVQPYSWSRPVATDEILNPLDERIRLQGVLDQESLRCQFTEVTVEERLQDAWADPAVEPFFDLLHEQVVQKCAQGQGVKTILTGWGGDEAISFASRGFFVALFLNLRWALLKRELGFRAKEYHTSNFSMFRHRVLVPLLPECLYWKMKPSREGPSYINPEFSKAMSGRWHYQPAHGLREGLSVKSMMSTLLTYGHLTERIESWHLSGLKHDLTYGYPLLDRRIVEFALGCPAHLFFQDGEERYLFRQAVKKLLPPTILKGVPKLEKAVFDRLPSVDPNLTNHIWKDHPYVDTERAREGGSEKNGKTTGRILLFRALKILRLGGAAPSA